MPSISSPSILAAADASAALTILVFTAICTLIAFLAALLLRTRLAVLSLMGAGLFGAAIGGWIGGAVGGSGWPGSVTVAGASVHLLWTFVGALLTILVARVGRTRRLRG